MIAMDDLLISIGGLFGKSLLSAFFLCSGLRLFPKDINHVFTIISIISFFLLLLGGRFLLDVVFFYKI